MGIQFVSEQCFARIRGQGGRSNKSKPDKGKTGFATRRFSAREILLEAVRADGHCPHVAQPQPPTVHYGLPAKLLLTWYDWLEQQALQTRVQTASRGKIRQRADTPILIAAVASYPGPVDESNELYVRWRQLALEFFQEKYGERLISVLEHADEQYGHLHAFAGNNGASVKPLHSGHAPKLRALAAGAGKREQNQAYKNGTAAYQEDFYRMVGSPAGLLRFGPRRARKTRDEWQADQEQHRRMALALIERDKAEKDRQAAEVARISVEQELATFEWDKLEFDRLRRTHEEEVQRHSDWVLTERERLEQVDATLRKSRRALEKALLQAKSMQQALGEAAADIIGHADPQLRKVVESRLSPFFPQLQTLLGTDSRKGQPQSETDLLGELLGALEAFETPVVL